MSDRLRILVIGASGVLGRAIVAELSPRFDIVTAGSKSGDIRIDIADPASIESGLDAADALDAVFAPPARSISPPSRRSGRPRSGGRPTASGSRTS